MWMSCVVGGISLLRSNRKDSRGGEKGDEKKSVSVKSNPVVHRWGGGRLVRLTVVETQGDPTSRVSVHFP